ncbi:MAG: sodium-dependent transporter [Armatimonadota bacterium]
MTAPEPTTTRDSWATRAGFILAAVGSAVGLGNMWRFSYVAAEGGGAAFVILYVAFVAFIGVPLMTSEFIVGRLSQQSPVLAVRRLGGSGWAPLGWLFVVCGFGILSYYSVIAGWTMRYAVDGVRNAITTDTEAYFGSVSTGWPAIFTHLAFMAITIGIVVAGVKRGLERTALILMPLLFIMLLGLAGWASTLSGGPAGYGYYLKPQLSELVDPDIIVLAAGQAFFSLSLGMGALMTYASYLRSKENLGREAGIVAAADFGVAFVAGLVVFPIIFHFGLGETIGLGGAISDNTVGTLFIALPTGLHSLGGLGNVIISAFFIMLFVAAITSAISLLEVVVAAVIDGWQWTRTRATIVFGSLIAIGGLPSALSINFLAAADKFMGNFLLIAGGFFTSLLVGYRLLAQADAELGDGLDSVAARRTWAYLVRYLAPVVLLVVMILMVPAVWDAIKPVIGLDG